MLNFNCEPGAVTVNILPAIVGAGLLLLLALPLIVLIFNPGAGSGLPLIILFLVYACVCLPSWLPNQMISLVLIFGFLCRSSIFRYPDDLRNIVQQCACVSRNCRQHRFQLWSSCGNWLRKSWRKNLQSRRSFNGSISSLPISVRFVCVYLYVCICLCVFVFVSQQGHQQSTHPHRWKTPICQSRPSPPLTRRAAAHTESRNITLNMNSLSLSSKRFGKNNHYDWICFWQYVDDNLQIPAEYRALKQGSASTQDALNEVT